MFTRGAPGNMGATTSSVTLEVTEGIVKAASVFAPASPSASSPTLCWNARTAASVDGPKLPSIGPGSNPRCCNCCCNAVTCGPVSPAFNKGITGLGADYFLSLQIYYTDVAPRFPRFVE